MNEDEYDKELLVWAIERANDLCLKLDGIVYDSLLESIVDLNRQASAAIRHIDRMEKKKK